MHQGSSSRNTLLWVRSWWTVPELQNRTTMDLLAKLVMAGTRKTRELGPWFKQSCSASHLWHPIRSSLRVKAFWASFTMSKRISLVIKFRNGGSFVLFHPWFERQQFHVYMVSRQMVRLNRWRTLGRHDSAIYSKRAPSCSAVSWRYACAGR